MITVPLTQGKVALVSEEDYEWLSCFDWHACLVYENTNLWYAKTNLYSKPGLDKERGKLVRMHREVARRMGVEGMVDHRDGDGLNNQRDNLRPCTQAQNIAAARFTKSESGYRGVYRNRNLWEARIKTGGRIVRLGTFKDKEEAAQVRDKAALALWGEFAQLNLTVAT